MFSNDENAKKLQIGLLKKLKRIKLVRLFFKPWQDKKLARLHEQYINSGCGEELKKFKNICQGKRCFIIGNGPSLKASDLNCLKDEYTFAANRIYEIFDQTDWRPWSYVVVDEEVLRKNYKNILKVQCKYRFLLWKVLKDDPDTQAVRIFENLKEFTINRGDDYTAYIPEEISTGFSRGYTVTFTSIQLAIYMGFKEIYLLGVDFNYSIYIDENDKIHHNNDVDDYFINNEQAPSPANYGANLYAYQKAKEYADAHGIRIYNATRGGKLEVFERVNFDDLFNMKNQK